MKLRIRHGAVTVWTTLTGVPSDPRPAPASLVIAVTAATLVVGVSGCGSSPPPPPPATSSSVHVPARSIAVFAAVALKPAFTSLAQQFQADNGGATVDFTFATSTELANKLTRGAEADVFAASDTAQMDTVVKADLASGEPVDFASNTLVIVTAPGNPRGITSFADLTKPDLRVAACQASAPCGTGMQLVEDDTGVRIDPTSEDTTGAAVLAHVTAGHADAGVVYGTDAQQAGDSVTTVRFPEAARAVNNYPIVALKRGVQSALAERFVELVTGPAGRQALTRAGFAGPQR